MTGSDVATDPDVLDALTIAAAREIMNASDALRNACARHYALPQSDLLAISHLAAVGPMSASELAGRLQLTGATVTSVADRLAKVGLARRVAHETDRRRVVIEVTELGLSRIGVMRQMLTRALAGMADPEHVAAVLTEVAARMQAQVAGIGALLGDTAPDDRTSDAVTPGRGV